MGSVMMYDELYDVCNVHRTLKEASSKKLGDLDSLALPTSRSPLAPVRDVSLVRLPELPTGRYPSPGPARRRAGGGRSAGAEGWTVVGTERRKG